MVYSLGAALTQVVQTDNKNKTDRKYIAVQKEGNNYSYRVVSLSNFEKLIRRFGFGSTCPKIIAKAIIAQSEILKQFANEHVNEKDSLQKIVNNIFTSLGKVSPIDFHSGEFTDWMQTLPDSVKNKPLTQLLIPGSHDSAAYKVDFLHSPKKFQFIQSIVRMLPFIGQIIVDWTQAQNCTISQQLENGIRFFDFRISYHENDNKFYLSHTFTCVPLDDVLNEIKEFMEAHKGEVIVLQVEADSESVVEMIAGDQRIGHRREDMLLNTIHEKIGDILCPPQEKLDNSITIKNLVDQDKRAVLFYKTRGPLNPVEFNAKQATFNDKAWSAPNFLEEIWTDSHSIEELPRNLENKLKPFSGKPKDSMRVISLTVTPDAGGIVKNVLKKLFIPWKKSETLLSITQAIHNDATCMKSEQVMKKVSIITTDFPDYEFVQNIIQQNI